ncbi:ATP-binding protein [Ostreibacterium oceani]|uniref:DUF87 domain-containing protein n=1 Tax=Ostreibacterium oceani TaxID=2654998 RepID=A0A6N7EV25_9GAMM|nr:DUF87 domain-containing protein [Ostreibacterium oceani]MPV86624.1 DUF87 domain-containing protein [Ostreibacterium oceani]
MKLIEQIGSFYLGKTIDEKNPELIRYDAKDLTTHAVIIGMTGSGKTGLGVCLLEEALLDGIPVIAVDPKGDMGNLLLTFPELAATDFEPWIDPVEAEQNDESIADVAKKRANQWKQGLADSHQTPERLAALNAAVEKTLYTPGATFGRPISLLKSLAPPKPALRKDKDLYQERISAATTGILSLLKIDNDPLAREQILVCQLLEYFWDQGKTIALADLIATIQNPPFERIGVMDVETIYPAKDRLKLAMQLNNLLASPGFEAWTQGDALDAERLLFSEHGKPRLSVMNIAHLSDNERIFFVTMLLNDILAWMRTQPGTGSLRAILYIDELFGYMPPIGNPATKPLLLTLLKQARAYGLGVVLSTQNPVDLDYKGLSNSGTWFIGRLQTEQDRNRVMDGLLSASKDGLDKKALNAAFDSLGKRKFLMHNIHEDAPIIMTTRWAMSYLSGPLSRQQIQLLTQPSNQSANEKSPNSNDNSSESNKDNAQELAQTDWVKYANLAPEIAQFFLPTKQVITDTSALHYQPTLMAIVNIHYEDTRADIRHSLTQLFTTPFVDGPIAIDWRNAIEPFVDKALGEAQDELIAQVTDEKPNDAKLLQPPISATQKAHYRDWEKAFVLWVRQNKALTLYHHEGLNDYAMPGESESQFRQRIAIALREARDEQLEQLRTQIGKKLAALEAKRSRAEARIAKEQQRASNRTMDAIVSTGSALLSAFMSRKKVSVTNARRLGSALKKASTAFGDDQDIPALEETIKQIDTEIQALASSFEQEMQTVHDQFDAVNAPLSTHQIYPKSTAITIHAFGVGWQPGLLVDEQWRAV